MVSPDLRQAGERSRRQRLRREDGQTLILVVLALPMMLAVMALVIDSSMLMVQRRSIQGAADAAALAASQNLEPSDGACTSTYPAAPSPSCVANVELYSRDNAGPSDLVPCDATHATNCWAAPYVDNNGVSHPRQIEVRLTKKVPTLLGGAVGLSNFDVSARAVAGFGHGTPPPYNFVSLNPACEKHTLLVKLGGQLKVTGAMYVDSCNSPDDGFDIFGTGGNIAAPDIRVVGGWETHDGSTVTVNGITCSLIDSKSGTSPAGCPKIGQSLLADPFAGKMTTPTLGGPACSSPIYATSAYSPVQKLSTDINTTDTTIDSMGTAIQTGDYIEIDSERMLVTGGGGTATLTVLRAQLGTTAASHNSGKAIDHLIVTGTTGTAASPAACDFQSGTVTLQPGTYYGGICIGATSGNACNTNCNAGTAHVTLAPGIYVMAGGGFWVCGSSTLTAPNVTIYNTNDPSHAAGSGAIDQVELNTSGSVTLGPQTTGLYTGLTIFQDTTLTLADSNCDAKSKDSGTWDIALLNMASTGANGQLGSISGTIYAPHKHAMFADSVSGRANLAVFSGCIYIDGGNSTFDYQSSGLFGVGSALGE
jgi:hypothetical protein